MPVVFLTAKGVAQMVGKGKNYEDVDLPRIYKTSIQRIEAARAGPEGGDILKGQHH